MTTWTVIDEQRAQTVEASESGHSVLLEPSVLGWQRKPEGLCRNEICVPVPAGTPAGALDATLLSRLLQRPLAIDAEEHTLAFAASATDRAEALRSGLAPDFELPDVHGVLHRLSDFRGKKVVLYAYASW